MLFNSLEFILLFLPSVFVIYFYLNYKRLTTAGIAFLIFSSLLFYGYWDPKYIPLILGSILFNFIVGTYLSKQSSLFDKKYLLIFGVLGNLLLLGYFKYTDFFLQNFNAFVGTNLPLPHIILPLGISFFTFTQIAFLVDCYRGYVKEYNFLKYALFVTYFPHLLAGPILHHSEMMPQFANKYHKLINYKNISIGLFLFSIGLFKKVVIADTFAVWATAGFDNSMSLTFLESWATSFSYTFQLYFDFSGYTDMAVGISLLFNIKLPINFNSPYKALDIQDFWRRWHMTLSRFLRDYIYIPLGGNRQGEYKTYINLFATFFLGGFWHGAGWTFIFWGGLHGIALMCHRMWKSLGFSMNKHLAWFITFNFINITWVFFRAKEWTDAINILKGMIGLNGVILPKSFAPILQYFSLYGIEFGRWNTSLNAGNTIVFWILSGFFITVYFKNSNQMADEYKPTLVIWSIVYIIFNYAILKSLSTSSQVFLYFNF